MKILSVAEMRSVEGGATYYYEDCCPICGSTITGKASGWKIFAPFLKAAAKKNFYSKLNTHLEKHS